MAEIRLVNLTKEFGSLVAVDNLELTVADGSFVALLGPPISIFSVVPEKSATPKKRTPSLVFWASNCR